MIDFAAASVEALTRKGGYDCDCGLHHEVKVDFLRICPGAVNSIPEALEAIGAQRPFVVCDRNTMAAAWDQVKAVLDKAGVAYTLFCFPGDHVEPDELAMGSLVMAFDPSCDCVMAVGSGVINDCCKVLAHAVGRKQLIVGTAPSMDGYASDSSAMVQNRLKVNLYSACPAAIICDIDIIKNAPMKMLWAGFGDMIAKYVALCEWRISHLVTGEYYCENVAGLMRESLKKVVANAPGLKVRDEAAVQATVEGLVLAGIAMSYAKVSRPASGLEHQFSHVWEMMALERNQPFELHGIQVGVGTLITLKLYEKIRRLTPDREKAEKFIRDFDEDVWAEHVRRILGQVGESAVEQEHTTFHNNDRAEHAQRLEKTLNNWDEIQRIIAEELPETETIIALMQDLGMPMTPADLGISRADTEDAFKVSRDVRKKYLTSSLLWDLGLLYETELPE